MERVACRRGTVQAEDDGRLGRTGHLNALVTFVEHGLDAAIARTGHDDVALMQCSVGHQHRGHISTALVKRGLDDGTGGLAVGVGLQVEHFSFQKNLLQQFVDAKPFLG